MFPYAAFLNQCRKFGGYALFVGSILLPILCADLDSMPDVNEISENGSSYDEQEHQHIYRMSDESAYDKRVTDIFDDMARFGYM